ALPGADRPPALRRPLHALRARGHAPDRAAGRFPLLPGRDHRGLQLHRQHVAPQDLPSQRAGRLRADHAALRRGGHRAGGPRADHLVAGAGCPARGRRHRAGQPPPGSGSPAARRGRASRIGAHTMMHAWTPVAVSRVLAVAALAPSAVHAQALASRELQAEAAQLVQELARLRGLPSTGAPPRVVVRTREERRRFILGELKRKYPESRLSAERRAMGAWGLVPPGFDLGGFLTDLVLEQAAAYYDPVAKVMVLANWLGAAEQREALTHELVHFLQDRQIELDRFLTAAPGRGDEALARQALIEGEAVALTLDRALRQQGQDLARLPDVSPLQKAIAASGTGPVLGRAPAFLRALLPCPHAPRL